VVVSFIIEKDRAPGHEKGHEPKDACLGAEGAAGIKSRSFPYQTKEARERLAAYGETEEGLEEVPGKVEGHRKVKTARDEAGKTEDQPGQEDTEERR